MSVGRLQYFYTDENHETVPLMSIRIGNKDICRHQIGTIKKNRLSAGIAEI
jgi:hypothetical protein